MLSKLPQMGKNYLSFGIAFEFSLGFLGLLGCWLFSIDLRSQVEFSWSAILWGVGATFPALLLLVAMELVPFGPISRIRDYIFTTIGQLFAKCNLWELLMLAVSAGIGEELLFRGFVQQSLEYFGYWPALIVASIAFGLVHSITPTYAILATVMGIGFGLLLDASGERNLWTPIITHALYDWVAFIWIAHEVRRQQSAISSEETNDSVDAHTVVGGFPDPPTDDDNSVGGSGTPPTTRDSENPSTTQVDGERDA